MKNTLIIIATLILGFVIGFLANSRLSQIRIDNMRQEFTQRGMDYRFIRALEPSPEQLKIIRPILDKYNDIRMNNLQTHWEDQKQIFDDFEDEIKPYLTNQQLLKFERIKDNLNRKKPKRKDYNKRSKRKHRNSQRN